MDMDTVVLRLVGVATLVGQRQAAGEATVAACVGGYGPVAGSACEAADQLLRYRPVRIPREWEATVRCVLGWRALTGRGPEGEERRWEGREVRGG